LTKLALVRLARAVPVAIGVMLSPALAQEVEELEDFVVTATGRAAALDNAPLAVSAIGGQQLQDTGAQDLRDVVQLAPSFSMSTGQSTTMGTAARIRGVATSADNPGFEAAVGIFIDGVYRARPGAALGDLPEVERIEVLRGPQSTLFGRNTSAGAISVVTAQPDFAPGMSMEASFGLDALEEAGARVTANAPVSQALAFRVDAAIRAQAGAIRDLISERTINDRDRWSARAQALWRIGAQTSLRVIIDGGETDENCCGAVALAYGFIQGAIVAVVGPAGAPEINPRARAMTISPAGAGLPSFGPGLPAQPTTPARGYGERSNDMGVSAHFEHAFQGVRLSSITAYRDWNAARDQDGDFNLIDIAYRDQLEVSLRNFTQEVRLQGETARLFWLVGAFYADERLDTTDRVRMGAHANLYANALTQGATAPLSAIGGPAAGCELYDSAPGGEPDLVPSFFYCASDNPATPLVFDPNPALADVYLIGHTAGEGQQRDAWRVDTESFALFTHNEISLSDNLTLTLGARFSHERKNLSANLFATSTSCTTLHGVETATGLISVLQMIPGASALMTIACNPLVNPIANGAWRGGADDEAWSGRVSLAYRPSPRLMLYAGYSRGFKAGGFNVDRSGFALTPALTDPAALNVGQLKFGAETTDNYEIGARASLFGAAALNITAFHQEISDYQLNAFNGFNFVTRNIPDAVSRGVELELAARLTDALTITGAVTYNDAYFDSTIVFNQLDPGPNTVRAGHPFPFAPEWVATGSIGYRTAITSALDARFYLDGRWDGAHRTQTLGRDPRSDNKSYTLFNGRIGVGPRDQSWAIELWGRNLFDEFYHVGAINPPLQDTLAIYPNPPRTWGIAVRARY
jgi:outer membrane receptor protein involved in Fe transport